MHKSSTMAPGAAHTLADCDIHVALMLCHAMQGSMSALPLTIISRAADGSRHFITPPPAHILPQASKEAAQVRWGGAVVMVA
jgi:hypothetical protein